jgi:hypothetical protein
MPVLSFHVFEYHCLSCDLRFLNTPLVSSNIVLASMPVLTFHVFEYHSSYYYWMNYWFSYIVELITRKSGNVGHGFILAYFDP